MVDSFKDLYFKGPRSYQIQGLRGTREIWFVRQDLTLHAQQVYKPFAFMKELPDLQSTQFQNSVEVTLCTVLKNRFVIQIYAN